MLRQSASWADLNAFAAPGAGCRLAPGRVEIGNEQAADTAIFYIPGMCALDLAADTDAAGTENTAVMIQKETGVGGIDAEPGIETRQIDMIQPKSLSHLLQFAVTVSDTDRADMIALAEHQGNDGPAVMQQAIRVGGHFHAFGDAGGTGRKEFAAASQFHHA